MGSRDQFGRRDKKMHLNKETLLSLIIPVYNEEENVQNAYEKIIEFFHIHNDIQYEIIFTDNCSEDRTFEIIPSLAINDDRIRAYRWSKNVGYHRSNLYGDRQCTGDIAVQLDCDLQDPLELIPVFLSKWKEGFSVVYGIRKKRQENFVMNLIRKIFYRLVKLISRSEIPADAGDFRLIDRRVLNELIKLDINAPYLRGIIAEIGFKQIGVSYSRNSRKYGKSKFRVKDLISLGFDAFTSSSTVLLQFPFYLTIFIFMFSIIGLFFYTGLKFYTDIELPAGFTTIVTLILFSIAVNSFFLGIFGLYLGRLFNQVNSKTPVILDKKID